MTQMIMNINVWRLDRCCITCRQVWSVRGPPCIAAVLPWQKRAQLYPREQPGEPTSGRWMLRRWPSASETWRTRQSKNQTNDRIPLHKTLLSAVFSHLESQSPPSRHVFSWVMMRLSWASSLMESWISLLLSVRLILKRFRYSSITSWSSKTLCLR